MVALFHRTNAGFDDDPRALIAEDGGEQPFRIGARERELIGMTDAGRSDFDQDFTGARSVKLDGRDYQAVCQAQTPRRREHPCDRSSVFAGWLSFVPAE